MGSPHSGPRLLRDIFYFLLFILVVIGVCKFLYLFVRQEPSTSSVRSDEVNISETWKAVRSYRWLLPQVNLPTEERVKQVKIFPRNSTQGPVMILVMEKGEQRAYSFADLRHVKGRKGDVMVFEVQPQTYVRLAKK